MLTNSFIHLINKSWKNTLELMLYAVTGIVLMGHVFMIEGAITYANSLLVMLGIVVANLAVYQMTPVSNWVDGKDLAMPADILTFHQKEDVSAHPDVLHSQKAA